MIYTVTLNPAVDRELTVPAIEFDSVLRATAHQVDFGGKGFNVSRVLRNLGVASTALGFAGGKSGELLRDGLQSLGISTDFTWIGGETRTNVSIVSTVQKRYVKANEPGPTISDAERTALLEQIKSLTEPGDWWVLAGSLPPGVPADIYAEMIDIIKSGGGHTILDTSGSALDSGCYAGPYLVKPNTFEANKLTGLPVDTLQQIAAAAATIHKMGVTSVVISMGKDGAMLHSEGKTWIAHSPPVEEINPIGAGDSLVGGLVYGLQAGYDQAESLRWGIACGAAAASLSGTAVGDRELVEKLLAQVNIEAL